MERYNLKNAELFMKKIQLKKSTLIAVPVLLMISLSFAFSPSTSFTSSNNTVVIPMAPVPVIPPVEEIPVSEDETVATLYSNLDLDDRGLSEEAFSYAMKGFRKLVTQGKISNQKLLTIADFTKSSSQKRLYVIDIATERVLYQTWVAHGRGSGAEYADRFSNIPESYQSSLGFYETAGTYVGKNGYSLRLEGLENGINSNALNRAIVIHGAPYVSEGFIKARGYIGRSHGCPALPEKLNKPIIETIKNGSAFFIFSKKNNYLERSKVLNA